MMKLQQFKIGTPFKSFCTIDNEGNESYNYWLCTDFGTRVVVAIRLDKDDASWYNGPPYAVVEEVLDKHHQDICYPLTDEELALWKIKGQIK